jgi:predicted enzyme related to lactoylglutathione lyase
MSSATRRGQFVWHELLTSDSDAAAAFYTRLIGWKTQAWPHDPNYRVWTASGVPVGGLMQLSEEMGGADTPPYWVTYVAVPDVDATVRQATALGAKTSVPPTDIPNAGRFAMLVDPQGAAISVYSSSQPQPEEPSLGGFTWHELATTDWKAAWQFYRTLFGWEKTSEMDMGPQGIYFMFGLGGRPLGGIYNKTLETPMPNWLPYISVKNADAVATATPKQGGRIITGPMEVPGGDRITVGIDPQGAAFAVHWISATAPVAAKPRKKAKPKTKPKAKAKPKAKKKVKRR